MNIDLTLTTKNYALIKDLTLQCNFVPRIGEIILLDQNEEYFVYDIKYELGNSTELTPHLWCREWFDGDRYIELADRGWAPMRYK